MNTLPNTNSYYQGQNETIQNDKDSLNEKNKLLKKEIKIKQNFGFKPVKTFTQIKNYQNIQHIDFKRPVFDASISAETNKKERFYSDYIFPCFIVITKRRSIKSICNIIDSIDGDPVPQLQRLMPSLSLAIRSFFKSSNFAATSFVHDQQYFNFAHSLTDVSDENVLMLTGIIFYSYHKGHPKSKILMHCSKYVSKVKGSLNYFVKFIDSLLKGRVIQKKETPNFDSIPETPTKRELVGSFFSSITHELNPETIAPVKRDLPPFTPRPIPEDNTHLTKSYVRLQTPLQKRLSDALLFNTQYVSLPSGSEGGNKEQALDEQYLNDKEYYFAATAYIPDAEVRVYRLEKAINVIENGTVFETYMYPGYLVNSIKDVYGPSSYRVFELMSKNYEKVSKSILPTLIMAKDRYYDASMKWEQFHRYENCVFGRQMYLRVPDPDLSLPANIKRTNEWENLHKMFSVLALQQNENGNGAIDDFFRIMKAIKNPSYFPRIVVSALQLIPSILESMKRLESFIDSDVNEEIRYMVKVQLSITEIALKSSLTKEDSFEDDFILSDAPRVMKIVVKHYSDMQASKPGRTIWDTMFGCREGHLLTKRINAFIAIMGACDVRDEFWPLVDLFDDVHKKKVKNSQYHAMAKKLCPFRELFEISQKGDVISCKRAPEKNIQVILPVMFIPPKNI